MVDTIRRVRELCQLKYQLVVTVAYENRLYEVSIVSLTNLMYTVAAYTNVCVKQLKHLSG